MTTRYLAHDIRGILALIVVDDDDINGDLKKPGSSNSNMSLPAAGAATAIPLPSPVRGGQKRNTLAVKSHLLEMRPASNHVNKKAKPSNKRPKNAKKKKADDEATKKKDDDAVITAPFSLHGRKSAAIKGFYILSKEKAHVCAVSERQSKDCHGIITECRRMLEAGEIATKPDAVKWVAMAIAANA